MSEISNKINEIVAGFGLGLIAGIVIAILALIALNIWYLFVGELVFLATITIWIVFAIISTSYYKLLRETLCKEAAFYIGLCAIIGLVSYSYNILDILPYNSLQTHQIVALVMIGTCVGLAKIVLRLIIVGTEKTAQ